MSGKHRSQNDKRIVVSAIWHLLETDNRALIEGHHSEREKIHLLQNPCVFLLDQMCICVCVCVPVSGSVETDSVCESTERVIRLSRQGSRLWFLLCYSRAFNYTSQDPLLVYSNGISFFNGLLFFYIKFECAFAFPNGHFMKVRFRNSLH